MSGQFSDLVAIAGITVLVTLLWAALVAFTYWDTRNRGLAGRTTFAWLALVALLPFVGFATYVFARALALISSISLNESRLPTRRETALKQPPARQGRMPTLIASDLATQTIADPNRAIQDNANRRQASIQYVFAVTAGADRGKEFAVENLPAHIGRGSGIAIRLDGDLGVSRKHAELYERAGTLRIRDLKSTHGTQVNGSRVEDGSLEPGDLIQVGLSILVVKVIEG